MESIPQKILVVGGNGFLGIGTSIRQSGKPYKTPKGRLASGRRIAAKAYSHLLPGVTAVVHTLGTLLEDTRYKAALKEGDISTLLSTFVFNVTGGGTSSNPLAGDERKPECYESLNRDAALRVCEAFLSSSPTVRVEGPRSFVFASAEDIFRPLIPARYIETKREAELGIEQMVSARSNFRVVYIRPSLIYHPHFRPLTSPVAALLDLSATVHAKMPPGLPTPSGLLRSLASRMPVASTSQSIIPPSPLESVANALTIPPIHVDHVAEAMCIAVDNKRSDIRGVVDVREMRELIGWSQKGQQPSGSHVREHV